MIGVHENKMSKRVPKAPKRLSKRIPTGEPFQVIPESSFVQPAWNDQFPVFAGFLLKGSKGPFPL